jgi:hypothetical protein
VYNAITKPISFRIAVEKRGRNEPSGLFVAWRQLQVSSRLV